MSIIEKMSIMGIRSFGPEDHNRQMIEFFKPLTLILGPNGSGKTTIIECLRYITTGDPPPNSDRGGSFVHDPKFAGEQEVKGQVKLQFRDVVGRKVIVTRSLRVSQSLKKLTLKTLEGAITRYGANNEKTNLSTKCAEIDAEMIGALGVSKAILNNVIFCHQEESNWPLSEGKALKQKFDEIFAATRYIKALEEIRKIRIEKMTEIKVYETQVESLMSNKRKAEEYRQELDKTETRLSVCKDTVQDIENKLKPINEKVKEIKVKQNEIGKLQASLDSNLDLIKKYEKDEIILRKSIKSVFPGTKDELMEEMKNFDFQVSKKRKKLEKLRIDISNSEVSLQSDLKSRSCLQEELGKLKADHERYKNLIKHRDSKLKKVRKSLGLGDLGLEDDELLADSQVKSIMHNLQKRNNATQNELQNCKTKHESNETRIQANIEKAYIEKAQKQQKLSSSKEQMAKNKIGIRNINSELSRLDSLASHQDDLEAELKEAEQELNSLDGRINVDEYREKLSKKRKKKEEIESQLEVLTQEMNQLQKESKTRTEIDLVNKEINSKIEAIDKVLQRHKETITHLLQEMPEHDIHEKIAKLINALNQKVQAMSKDLEKERSTLSSLETTKKFHENELDSKEKTLAEYQNKIFEVCGSQDFDYGCDSLKTTIRELQDEKGALTGSLYLYNKYIEKLGKPQPCCPLCTRSFQGDDEAHSLVNKLQRKLQTVPSALEQKTKLIAEKEKLLNKMLQLKPVKDIVFDLSEKGIPELKRKIETVTADLVTSNSKISEMEEVLDDLSCDMKMASNIAPDLIIHDQNQRELERLKRRLSNLKTQIGGKDITRNAQQVSEEQTMLQNQVKSLNTEIAKGQEEINNYREQMQHLRERVNNLNAEKNKMCSDMQKKSTLLEQLENLSKENSELIDVITAVKLEITGLDTKLRELGKEKSTVTKLKEEELETIRKKIREEEKEMESIDNLSKDINRYISENREKVLAQHEDKLKEISFEIDKKKDEKNYLVQQEMELNKDITSQELIYRDLEDNKKLIEVIEEISGLNLKCQNLHEKIGGYNIRTLLNDLEKFLNKERELMKERDESVGRESMLREKIRNLKKELQDDMFKDAEKKHRDKCIELRTTQVTIDDLSKYYAALNKAIMSYHKLKMCEINKIVRDLWIKTYAGNDIDYIEIQSDEDDGGGLEKAKRQYNYRVVMFKGDTPIDMRGRCSAGQKVLASLIIRLALAETFCLNCGILALDEPTTNLDNDNISNLARALVEIVQSRSDQRNFQLIIITHDECFIERLGRSEVVDYYYRVSKDSNAFSKVSKLYISSMA